MNKLRSNQLFAILLMSGAFTFLCQAAAYTLEGVLGAAIAAAVQLLLSLPILFLYHRGFSFSDYAEKHRLLPFCFVIYLLARGGVSFIRIQKITVDFAFPVSGKWMAAGLITLVCLYTASLGIRAMARSSTLIFWILLFSFAVMLLGALPQAKPQNLSFSPNDTIWNGFFKSMQTADELPLLFLLLDFIDKNRFRTTVQIWVGKWAVFAYLSFLGMAVLGNRMTQAKHPFFDVISISQPFSTQRADSLYFLLFVMLCVFRITLFTVLSAHLLRTAFPKLPYSGIICLLLMLGVSWAASTFSVSAIWNVIALGFLTFLVPIGLFATQKQRGVSE